MFGGLKILTIGDGGYYGGTGLLFVRPIEVNIRQADKLEAGMEMSDCRLHLDQSSLSLMALGLLILTSCSQVSDRREADARALREGEVAAFVKDWGGKDADRVAVHFTDDGNLMVPNAPVMTGKDGIGKGMKGAMADPNWSLGMEPVQVEVSRSNDLGYVRGTYVLTATDPASTKVATEKGRFVAIFRKQADGSWKAAQQISNAEALGTLK